MRKNFFLWTSGALLVLLLIVGFENIFTTAPFSILFFTFDQFSALMTVFISAFIGFLICFFFMLYSYEKRLEKEREEAEETMGSSPGAMVEKQQAPEEETPKKKEEKLVQESDEEDETLG